jgi:hypothetical protein
MVFEQVITTLQKVYGFWASYNNTAKSVWFLNKLYQHFKKHMVFEQVTTIQKACVFLANYNNIAQKYSYITK